MLSGFYIRETHKHCPKHLALKRGDVMSSTLILQHLDVLILDDLHAVTLRDLDLVILDDLYVLTLHGLDLEI